MSRSEAEAQEIGFREARRQDLPAIVRMLADDALGAGRESQGGGALPPAYEAAFDVIAADPRNLLIVGESQGRVVACLQLTFIPGLTYTGGERAQIEGVRIETSLRGQGVGRALIEHAIGLARRRGCVLVQLTTDKRRPEALAFYQSLGFAASHEGMKLRL